MVKHLIEKISKSIQFTQTEVSEMSTLAKSLGFTRNQGGIETGDISKLVRRFVRFALDNLDTFKQWSVNGKVNVKKETKTDGTKKTH